MPGISWGEFQPLKKLERMTKRSENRRIEAKIKEWDRIVRPVNRFLKKQFVKVIRFLFCYQEEDDMDLFLHIVFILAWLFIGWFSIGRR